MKKQFLILFIPLATLLYLSCDEEAPISQVTTCTISNPKNGEEIEQGQTVFITVDVNDNDKKNTVVHLYLDGLDVGSSKSFPFNYNWDTSDEETGHHLIKATALYESGSSKSEEISVLLTENKNPPIADFKALQTYIRSGDSIQFTDQSANKPNGWLWDFGDGETSIEQNPKHKYTTGEYTVSLKVSNNFGDDTITKTKYIKVDLINLLTMTDHDGNTYKTVTIDTQTMMAENLKVTHYPNGNEIQLVTDSTAWANFNDNYPAYCYYENNINSEYGALYTYAAALNACPSGWHLPSDDEWLALKSYLTNNGHNGTEGNALKTTSAWKISPGLNGNGTDDYAFSGLPGGVRAIHGGFSPEGEVGYWWSRTEIDTSETNIFVLHYIWESFFVGGYYKSSGCSVRCFKDN